MCERLFFLSSSLLCLLLTTGGLSAQSSNLVLESRIPYGPCTTADVWAVGDYMLLARRLDGFAIVYIRDPRNPVVKTIFPPGYPRAIGPGINDIKSDGRYIYVGDQGAGQGVFIYDTVPDPMNPTLVSTLVDTPATSVHNLWVDGNYLYAQKWIFDVTDKANPTFWRAGKMYMVNHQTGKSTVLLWSEYEFQTGMTDRDFDKNSLARSR